MLSYKFYREAAKSAVLEFRLLPAAGSLKAEPQL
jgi:hypothetical protein